MDDRDRIANAVTELLDTVGRDHLSSLHLRPVSPESLDGTLARTFDKVSPSFLPFAVEDAKTLAVHLWPGRALADSPIVLIDKGERGATQLCSRLATLPSTLWLWELTYFEDELDVLDAACGGMATGIPDAHYPRGAFVEFEEEEDEVSRWQMTKAESGRAWKLVDPGHPFAHLALDEDEWDYLPGDEAYPRLRAMFEDGPGTPEELAQLVGCGLMAEIQPTVEDASAVLGAEAFRRVRLGGYGPWVARGDGLQMWDGVLSRLDSALLSGSLFESLSSVPRAYSGAEKAGVAALARVANAARDAGRHDIALAQLRNASLVALMTFGELPPPLFARLAGGCDRISDGSLAAAVARYAPVAIAAGP
jgi:hypothetical protein